MAKKSKAESTQEQGEHLRVLARFESQYAARAFEPGDYDAADQDALSLRVLRQMAATDAPHFAGMVVKV